MIPPIVGVPAFSWWPSGPSSRMNWPNSRLRRNAMNFGDRKMQMSSAAVPAIRTSPISVAAVACSASATTSRPTPREALTSTVSPGATSAGHERRGRRGVGDARARRRRTCPAMCAARGPTVTSTSTPRSRACAPISAWKRPLVRARARACRRARRRGARPRSRRGRRVRRASTSGWRCSSRPRRRPAPGARSAGPRRALRRTSIRPAGSTPDGARRGQRRQRVAAHVGRGERQLDAAAGRRRRRRGRTVTVATSSRRCGASSGSPAGTTAVPPGRRPAMSSAFAAAIASSVPSSSRCTGPTFVITPTSGSAIAASSAICPAPRIAISSTSTSVPGGRAEDGERQADLGVEVLRGGASRRLPVASIAARRSFVEVLPVEPVMPMTWAPSSRRQARASACSAASGSSAASRHARRRRVGVVGADEDAPGARVQRGRREAPAVDALAAQADEEVARADVARVDHHALGPARRPGRAGTRIRAPAASATRLRRPRAHAAPRARPRRRRTGPSGRPRAPGPARGPCRR